MRNSMVLGCLALAALASCAKFDGRHLRNAANDVQIDIDVVRDSSGKKPEIKVDRDVERVPAGKERLVWSLRANAANGGYGFGDDGIRFEFPAPNPPPACTSTPDPAEAFDLAKCGKDANGRLFACPRRKGVHVQGACYKYTVRLIAETVPVDPKDPWIANE